MRTLLGSILSFFLTFSAPGYAAMVLTFGHAQPPEHPRARAAQRFAETIKERTRGRIVIDVAGAASVGDDAAMMKALADGSLDLTANSQGTVSAVVPEFSAIGMPFLFASPEAAWRILDGPAGQVLAQKAAAKGLIVLGFWDNGIRHLSNATRPIREPGDVRGLRIRTPADPVTQDVVVALGGKPVEMKFSDVYNALLRGVVDGQENPLTNILSAKLYEVQKYVSLTGHKYEITPLLMSKRAWDALTAADQAIFRAAAEDATRYQRQVMRQAEANAHKDLAARGLRIDKVDTRPFAAATSKIYDKWYASPIGDYVRMVVQAARADQ